MDLEIDKYMKMMRDIVISHAGIKYASTELLQENAVHLSNIGLDIFLEDCKQWVDFSEVALQGGVDVQADCCCFLWWIPV